MAKIDDLNIKVKFDVEGLEYFENVINELMMSLVLTQDYNQNPCLEGWTWYDIGKKYAEKFPNLEWSIQFSERFL